MNQKRKKKRRKSVYDICKEKVVIVILIIYFFYTVFSIIDISKEHSGVITDRPNALLRSVWLDSTPFYQEFRADKMTGVRIWLSNPYNISEGVISVKIGDAVSKDALYSEEILVTDISDSVLKEGIDIIPTNFKFVDDKDYYIELDALSCPDNTIKTYLGAKSSATVFHAGDERDFSGKMLCMALIQNVLPFSFIVWILATILIAIMVTFTFSSKASYHFDWSIFSFSYVDFVIIPILIIIGLFGTGVLSADDIGTKSILLGKEELSEGYVLHEHSSFTQQFKVKGNNLKKIHIFLDNNFENNGTFVVSIQKGQDEIIQSVQSVELDIDESYSYVWDVSNLGLEKGETYDLFIYTGFIEDDEEEPVIKRIECVYQ